ncbi:hypothetical protein D3C80_800700 [compost metagenome]
MHGQCATGDQQPLTLLGIEPMLLRLQMVKYLLPFGEVMRMELQLRHHQLQAVTLPHLFSGEFAQQVGQLTQ